MSSNKFKTIEAGQGALIVANSLKTGRTVYLTESSNWSECMTDARVINDDQLAAEQLLVAQHSEQENEVVGPYLIATDTTGRANHIRELIRQCGPTVLPDSKPLYPNTIIAGLAG